MLDTTELLDPAARITVAAPVADREYDIVHGDHGFRALDGRRPCAARFVRLAEFHGNALQPGYPAVFVTQHLDGVRQPMEFHAFFDSMVMFLNASSHFLVAAPIHDHFEFTDLRPIERFYRIIVNERNANSKVADNQATAICDLNVNPNVVSVDMCERVNLRRIGSRYKTGNAFWAPNTKTPAEHGATQGPLQANTR